MANAAQDMTVAYVREDSVVAERRWRIGVIGTGFIGVVHIAALRSLGLEVLAVASTDAGRAAEKARQFGVARAYGSAEELLDDPEIDVVHVASPNHLHLPHTTAALQAGKHVVCEKPLAMDSRESGDLVRLAAEKRLVNAVNFNLRYYPLNQHARALVHEGRLGDVHIVQGSYLQDWLMYPTDWNWRLEPGKGGALRAVADIGSHWIDLTAHITGLKVESVLADLNTFLPVRLKPTTPVETFASGLKAQVEYTEQPVTTEDYASVLFRYAGGARGVMTVSQINPGRKNRLYYEISGSNASIAWDSEQANELWMGHRDRPNELLLKDWAIMPPETRHFASYPAGHVEGFAETFKNLCNLVYNYLDRGDLTAKPDFPTFEDGHREMLVAEAILRSAREERWVTVD
jgi:predicted dehydrogenase